MSVEIHQYLDNSGGNNFTETAQRPPVGPGEENELHSTGGHSNKSSSSHKSHTSNKSANSNGAATPRRSQKVTKVALAAPCENAEEAEAPLGFEPEGSVDQKPDFTENSSPGCTKWAESLDNLLEDPDGVALFKKYLAQEKNVNLFEFYFAWKYLQELDPDEAKNVASLVKTMYKVFIKGDRAEKKLTIVSNEHREAIGRFVSSKQYSIALFDEVKDQVVGLLKKQFYSSFFKSDTYLQYVQAIEDSPKDSPHSSGSISARPLSTVLLPTVHEDSELDFHHVSQVSEQTQGSDTPVAALTLTANNVMMTQRLRLESKIKPEDQAGYYLQKAEQTQGLNTIGKPTHPYHSYNTSYLPISAIDSERGSLSSDALTDDTHSITDSSVDGFPQYSNKKSVHRYYKKQRNLAQRNPDPHLPSNHLLPQKNHRMPKVSNLAETNPKEFAKILSEKLQRIVDELNRRETVRSKLNAMSEDEATDDSHSMLSSTTGGATHPNTALNQLLLAMQAGDHDDAEAQDILDMHCKRIWERSGQHTPAKSPSRAKSPDHIAQQAKRTHAIPRQPQTASRPVAPYQKPAGKLNSSKPSAFSSLDASYPQGNQPLYRPSSRHGMATFSSQSEQRSVFKQPPVQQTNSNQKVVDWISHSMQQPNLHNTESERSSKRDKPGDTTSSPRPQRIKSHGKRSELSKHAIDAIAPVAKRSSMDDKQSHKSRSSGSSSKDRSLLSRSAGESSMAQTLTQRKGVPQPPQLKVAFFLPDEPIPYSVTVASVDITLAKFKELITKKGNYRYFFKKASDEEFGKDVPHVLEELTSDTDVLPKWGDKVLCYVKKA